ncbi:AI-2E family transporter, partial [Brevifollis gellanilyticus]|uniref:AI-2E family transporter n=1 Tax=Brevifollis gellanilyticus TaxID=748831 RepID=UPI0011BEEA67
MDPSYRTLSSFIKFFTALLVIAALYLGREVLIPLALACLFTFLLNPVVKRLCLWGLPRVASVCIVTIVSFSSLALIAGFLGKEMTNLANDLPNHQQNIQRRVQALKSMGDSGVIQKLRKLVSNVSDSSQKDDAKKLAAESGDAARAPAPADQAKPENQPPPADQAKPAEQPPP